MKTTSVSVIVTTFALLLWTFSTHAGQFTWTGALDTVYAKSGNWTGGSGVPSSNDTVFIVSGTNRPVLAQDQDVYYAKMTSGAQIDLKGFVFTVQNKAEMEGGTLSNGTFVIRGTLAKFGGTVFYASIDAEAGVVELSGGEFHEPCVFKTNGNTISTGLGGCVFYDDVTLIQAASRTKWNLAATYGDTFNGVLKVYQQSDSPLYLSNSDTTYYNGNIYLNNTGSASVLFGEYDGVSYLASGNTIAVGDSDYASGDLYLRQFHQEGANSQNLTLTGTAGLFLKEVHFEAKTTLSAPGILCDKSSFQDSVTITKTGAGANYWYGDNDFYGTAIVSNTGFGSTTDELRLSGVHGNRFYENATFQSNNKALTVDFKDNTDFYGNVSINHSAIIFEKSVTFKGNNDQTLYGTTGYSFNNVTLNKTSGTVTADTTMEVSGLFTFTSGYLVTDTLHLLTMTAGSSAEGASNASFVSGPVKKVGNTSFEFPVGKELLFGPVSISAPDTISDSFIAQYFNSSPLFGDSSDAGIYFLSSSDYWELKCLSGSANVFVTLSWKNDNNLISSYDVHATIALYNDTLWKKNEIDTIINLEGRLSANTSNSLNQFGFLTIANAGAGSRCSGIITNTGNLQIWGLNTSIAHGNCGTVTDVNPDYTLYNSNYIPYNAYCNGSVGLLDEINKFSLHHTGVALRCDNTLAAWGSNNYHQIGNSETSINTPINPQNERYSPAAVPVMDGVPGSYLDNIIDVSTGYGMSAAVDKDGYVWQWGASLIDFANSVPVVIGSGSSIPHQITYQNLSPVNNAIAVDVGSSHILILLRNGEVLSVGRNDEGQLGTGNLIGSQHAVNVQINSSNDLSGIKQISAGTSHSMALDVNGEVYCWGQDAYGEIGDGSPSLSVPSVYAYKVPSVSNIELIAAGNYYSIAIGIDSYGWGLNNVNQLGQSAGSISATPNPTPLSIIFPSGTLDIIDIDCGAAHCIALSSDGKIYGWGSNDFWQLGVDGTTFGGNTPSGTTPPVQITNHTDLLAPLDDPRIKCDFQLNYCWYDIPITSSQSWPTSAPDCYLSGKVLIENELFVNKGVTFTVNGIEIIFGPNGRIILEEGDAGTNGAQLILNAGAKLTAASNCMWKGIEVRGSASFPANNSRQAKVIINSGALIENAHNAITLGKWDDNYYSCTASAPSPSNPSGFVLSGSGGQIECEGGVFQHNARDIRFAPYRPLSVSSVIDSEFNGGSLRDSRYNSYLNMPLPHPFYATANPLQRASIGISKLRYTSLLIDDNDFKDYDTGLKCEDSGMNIDNNWFEDCRIGIDRRITFPTLTYVANIQTNKFRNVIRHINSMGGKNLTISDQNEFNSISPFGSQADNRYGIVLTSESAFNIVDNKFRQLFIGCAVSNSQSSGGLVGYKAIGNFYRDCKYSNYVQTNNPSLQFKCNNYDNFIGSGSYVTNWSIINNTLLANQGYASGLITTQAANWFEQATRNQITSVSSIPFTYFKHGNPPNDPVFGPLTPNPIGLITVDDNSPILQNLQDYATACNPVTGDPDRMANLDDLLDSLNLEMDTLVLSIDNQIADSLLSIIDEIYVQDTILDRLLNNGPLSDEVLIKAIQTYDAIDDEGLFEVLFQNSPFSLSVRSELDSRDSQMDEDLRDSLDSFQGINPPYITVAGLLKEITYYENENQLAFNEYSKYLFENDSIEKSIDLFRSRGDYESLQSAFGTYIELNEIDSAEVVLAAISEMDEADEEWIELGEILLALASEDKTWFDMNAGQETAIREIAAFEEISLARVHARNILHQVFRDTFPDYFEGEEFYLRVSNLDNKQNHPQTKTGTIRLIPNPCREYVRISFEESESAEYDIIFYNLMGQIAMRKRDAVNKNGTIVQTNSLKPGLYLIKAQSDSGKQFKSKLQVIK